MTAILRPLQFAAITVFLATACAVDPATAPTPPVAVIGAAQGVAAPPLHGPFDHPSGNAYGRVAVCTRRAEIRGTAVIGPRGGTMRVGGDRLFVPAGALDSRVKIDGLVVEGAVAEIQLEPHGLRFDRPALLVIDAAGCAIGRGDTPVLLYLGADGEVLERIDAVFDPESKQLTAPIDHFSTYAVGV